MTDKNIHNIIVIMDILEPKPKSHYDAELVKIIRNLKFKNYPIELKGSASISSQQYFSDYDLFSNISKPTSSEDIYTEIMDILKKMEKIPGIYFVELKIQNLDGSKKKWFPKEEIDKTDFIEAIDQLDFIKIDFITYIDYKFMELSILYKFSDTKMTPAEYMKSIKGDIKELKGERRFYKVLKRYFNIFKIKGDTEKLLYLNEIFNSDLGMLYQKISNLEAILKLLEFYKDDLTKKKVRLNLKGMREPAEIKSIKKQLALYSTALNRQAESILKEIE